MTFCIALGVEIWAYCIAGAGAGAGCVWCTYGAVRVLDDRRALISPPEVWILICIMRFISTISPPVVIIRALELALFLHEMSNEPDLLERILRHRASPMCC